MSPSCHFSKSFFLSRLYEKWSSSILKRPSYMSFPTQKAHANALGKGRKECGVQQMEIGNKNQWFIFKMSKYVCYLFES